MAPRAEPDVAGSGQGVSKDTITRLLPPSRPPFSASPPRLLIIGAGNRGKAYAKAITESSNGVLVGVVEPVLHRRRELGRRYIWGAEGRPASGQEFADWPGFVAWELERRHRVRPRSESAEDGEGDKTWPREGVDAVFVCVQDQMHKEVVLGLAPLDLHIMCEKPLAPNLEDCVAIYRSLLKEGETEPRNIFSIGHVLRYSPHNQLLRRLLLEDKVIGEVMSVNHTEPVGWYHFTHSYVRGNWRNSKTSAASLLAKSCHDMDMLYWLLGCAAAGSARPAHVPRDISSAGQLQFFRRERKPADAGAATNCLACAHEPACQFSARRVYTGRDLAGRQQSHFAGIVAPAADIEEAQPMGAQAPGATAALLAALAEDYDAATTPAGEVAARNWYGRCVWEADNDVCDNQTVTLSWDSEPLPDVEGGLEGRGCKTATLHMVAFTEKICQRFTHIYGVHGEMYADSSSIQVTDFRRQGEGATTAADRTKTYYPHVPEDGGHGDGDAGLTRQFVLAVDRVKNGGVGVAQAQREYMGCELRDIIMSHSMVFAAEEARTEKRVVDFQAWWDRKVASRLELSSGPGSGTS